MIPFSSSAGTIRINSSVTSGETFLILDVKTEGQEVIRNVSASVRLADSSFEAPVRASLSPGQSFRFLRGNCIPLKEGRYMARVRIRYSDQNLYPFSTVMLHPVIVGSLPPSALAIRIPEISLQEEAVFRGKIFNRSSLSRIVKLDFFFPDEFAPTSAFFSLTLPPKGGQSFETKIKNLGALPGGKFPIYVIASYMENGSVIQSATRSTIRIHSVKRWRNPWFWGLGLIVMIVGLRLVFKSKSLPLDQEQ